VRFRDLTIDDLCRMPLGELQRRSTEWKLTTRERKVAGELMREIRGACSSSTTSGWTI
jgi:excinuclease ABC subunit A